MVVPNRSNILIDAQGDAFLSDFGIARALKSVATGKSLALLHDARGDIRSLGIMLYQMLTGYLPYEAGTSQAAIIMQEHEPLTPPTSLNPNIPDSIEKVVLKALALPPQDSYPTAGAIAFALKQALATHNIPTEELIEFLNLCVTLADSKLGSEITQNTSDPQNETAAPNGHTSFESQSEELQEEDVSYVFELIPQALKTLQKTGANLYNVGSGLYNLAETHEEQYAQLQKIDKIIASDSSPENVLKKLYELLNAKDSEVAAKDSYHSFEAMFKTIRQTGADSFGAGADLQDLAHSLGKHHLKLQKLDRIILQANSGMLLDDILESIYQDFGDVIPYNRIGLALLEDAGKIVRARWAKTDQAKTSIGKGFSAPLEGSSLQTIIETGQPRIIEDMVEYLRSKPDSISTRLMVEEGIRSSLTYPLIANNQPIGFIFFSSSYPDTYTNAHSDTFLRIAAELSLLIEKERLVAEMETRSNTKYE